MVYNQVAPFFCLDLCVASASHRQIGIYARGHSSDKLYLRRLIRELICHPIDCQRCWRWTRVFIALLLVTANPRDTEPLSCESNQLGEALPMLVTRGPRHDCRLQGVVLTGVLLAPLHFNPSNMRRRKIYSYDITQLNFEE
jgi:hypothetical protein